MLIILNILFYYLMEKLGIILLQILENIIIMVIPIDILTIRYMALVSKLKNINILFIINF